MNGVVSAHKHPHSVDIVLHVVEPHDLLLALVVVQFNLGQVSGCHEFLSAGGEVNGVVRVFLVEHSVFDRVTLGGIPSHDGAIHAGTNQLLVHLAVVRGGSPAETSHWESHVVILDRIKLVAEHGADNLQLAVGEANC